MASITTIQPQLPPELDETAFNKDEYYATAFCGAKSVYTTRAWRKKGQGPPFRKINGNMVRYSIATLREWMESQPLKVGGHR
jgi:hypothetical protein